MWNPDKKKGVLCDFDLVTLRTAPHKRGEQRTGTVPFMAIELLHKNYFDGKIQRIYRHDVESFIWVLVWVVMHHDPNWARYKFWHTSAYEYCRIAKCEFLTIGYQNISPPANESPRWKLVLALLAWLRPFYTERQSEPLAYKMVYEQVMGIIRQHWVWED
jgi:hypothetical protein